MPTQPQTTSLTVQTMFEWAVRAHADRAAVSFHGETWTYRRVGDEAHRVGNALAAMGLEPGARVSILSSNVPEYLTTYFGSLSAGFSVTPVGVRLPAGDHAFQINDTGARVLFFHAELLDFVEAVRDELGTVERYVCFRSDGRALPDWIDRYEDVIAAASQAQSDHRIEPDDIAVVMYTGGTTGRPRGAVHTHGSWGSYLLMLMVEFGFEPDTVFAATGPLSHATMLSVLPTFVKGGRVAIMKDFDPLYLLRMIEDEGVTVMPVFPTMVYMMLDLPQTHETNFSSLRTAFYGGSPMAPERLEEAIKVFGDVFVQLYGQTETAVSTLRAGDHRVDSPEARRRLASCGKPVLGVEVRLVDDDDRDVPLGDAGEIIVRAPSVMRGYWNRPDETAEVVRGGWLHTGDVGRLDEDGYLYIVDRKKDMIVTGAYNVYSKEVEDVLAEHPAVAQAAVIGVPDPKWGEAVKACVVLRDGAVVEAEELIGFVRERKGSVQAPKSIDFLDALPLTQVLKPDKKVLRAPYWEGQARQVH